MEFKLEQVELYDDESAEKVPDFVSQERISKQVDLIYKHMAEAIGHGKSAEVVHIPSYEASVCYKILSSTRMEELYGSAEDAPKVNSPKEEAFFLSRVREVAGNVRVPKPLCYWEGESEELGHFKILILERLNAFTLQELLMNDERLSPDFDFETFSQNLSGFVTRMNEDLKIRHNDLTVTNVMIERETGMPCVIDFGDSEKEFGENERPFTKDKVAVKGVLETLKNHMRHQVALD